MRQRFIYTGFAFIFLSAVLTGCNLSSYTSLGVPNPPREWSTVKIPYPSDRIIWDGSHLALNADTWVYTDNTGSHEVDNYTRFLTFENPDSDGVGSFIDVEVKDDSGGGFPYTDYTVRLGVYQLTRGPSNVVNELEMYGQHVFTFRYKSRSNPYTFGVDDGTFGSVYILPSETYYGLWSLDQTTDAYTLNLEVFGAPAVSFSRLDYVMDTVINKADKTQTARYLQVFLQASQVLHWGWNGYGQGHRQIATIIGAIISSDEFPETVAVEYLSPMGIGSFIVEYIPPFPPLPTSKLKETVDFSSGYQIFSSIFMQESADDEYDWELEIGYGTGSGKLAGTTVFQVVGNDGAGNITGYDAILDFGVITTGPGDTSTDIANMVFSEDFELTINQGAPITIDHTLVNPGNLDLVP